MIGLFLSVHFLIQLIEETLGGAAIVPGQAHRERKPERSGCGLVEMAQAILNGGSGIFQHFAIAAAQQDDEFIARHPDGNSVLRQGGRKDFADLPNGPVAHRVAVAVVDLFEIVHVHHDAVQLAGVRLVSFLKIEVHVFAVEQAGSLVHKGVDVLQLDVDEDHRDRCGQPACGQTVEDALDDGAQDAGDDKIEHREKLNGNAGLFGAGDSINTLGKVKEQRGIKEKIQRAARVDIFCRDVEDEPGAEQVDDNEKLYEEERNAQRQDFPVQPPGAAVDTEIHEQAPQKAHQNGGTGAEGIGKDNERVTAPERLSVNEETDGLGDQREQRDRQHSIVKDGTGLFCLTVPDAEEEQKGHKDDTGSICDQNFRNVHGKPPFAVRG